MNRLLALTLCLLAAMPAVPSSSLAAGIAPYPLTINSRSATAPGIEAYRASARTYRLSFTDGSTAASLAGHTAFMTWATNDTATTTITGSVAVVSSTGGVADVTFSAAQMNWTPGRYMYEAGMTSNNVITVSRQGVMVLRGSPYATGTPVASLTSNITIAGYTWVGVWSTNNLPMSDLTITSVALDQTARDSAAAALATGMAAQVTADAALPRTSTNGAEWGSHADLYPRNNPSNWVDRTGATSGVVIVEGDTNALAQLVVETNRAQVAEALLYPRNNPSNWVTATITNGLAGTGLVAVAQSAADAANTTGATHTAQISNLYSSNYVNRAQATSGVVIVEADDLQSVVNRGRTATNMGAVTMASESGNNLVAGWSASGTGKANSMVLGNAAGVTATGGDNFYGGTAAGYGASGNFNFYGGYYAGAVSTGSYNFFGGNLAGYYAVGSYNVYGGYSAGRSATTTNCVFLGTYSGRNATGNNWLFLDVYPSDPGAGQVATNDAFVFDSNTTNLYLGRPAGTVNLRGTVKGITAAQVGAAATSGVQVLDFSLARIEATTNVWVSTNQVVVWQHGTYNTTNGIFFLSPSTGNRVWLLY